jgi:branched-subunit amino acid transport protein
MWLTVVIAAFGCFIQKYLGAAIPESFMENPTTKRIVALLPVSLLTALVAVQTVASKQELVIDARLPALLAASVALRFKANFIVVVLAAALTAATLRHFGLFS